MQRSGDRNAERKGKGIQGQGRAEKTRKDGQKREYRTSRADEELRRGGERSQDRELLFLQLM